MIENYNNYEDKLFRASAIPDEIDGCNFKNCTIVNDKNVTFNKCNIETTQIMSASTFTYCNIYYNDDTELPEGCILYKSNLNKIEE